MGRLKKIGSLGRFGARGGMSVRKRMSGIEKSLRAFYECPQCLAKKVKRVSVGVWSCRKCGYTFTGGAFAPVARVTRQATVKVHKK